MVSAVFIFCFHRICVKKMWMRHWQSGCKEQTPLYAYMWHICVHTNSSACMRTYMSQFEASHTRLRICKCTPVASRDPWSYRNAVLAAAHAASSTSRLFFYVSHIVPTSFFVFIPVGPCKKCEPRYADGTHVFVIP